MRKVLRHLPGGWQVSARPTVRGWQAIFFGALSLLVARLIGTTQLYQLAYAFAGLFLVAFVLGFFPSRGLGYARSMPPGERLMAGRPSQVKLVVSNASRVRSPGMEVVDHLPERRVLARAPIEGKGTGATWEPVLFDRRGIYELGPAQIRTTDPFGLLSFARRFGGRTRVVVYPEVFELRNFPLRGRSMETGTGGSFVRQGDEFSDLREYRHGDDRRHIHWKSLARTGELFVKEFDHDSPQRHAVVLDLQRPGTTRVPEAEVDDAVSVAGSVLRYLLLDGLPFRLMCADGKLNATAFGDNEAAYWRAMDLLAAAQADGDAEPGDFLAEKLREGRDGLGEGVILVSRSLGEGLVSSVRRLRTAGLAVTVVALAVHTYRGDGALPGREAAFSEEVRRLGLAGAETRVVRRPGGVAALARGRRAAV